MGTKINKLILFVGLFAVFGFLFIFKFNLIKINKKIYLPPPLNYQEITSDSNYATSSHQLVDKNIPPEITDNPDPQTVLKDKINLLVPFAVQAPQANWEMPYKEACEEASILMVYGFLKNKNSFTPDYIKNQIDELVDYQLQVLGEHKDLNLAETAQLAADYYKLNYRLISQLDADKIKIELSKGNPVIIPTAGRLLANPNFRSPGPLYHMLVVKGYQDDYFITNDPGTKNGENYLYKTNQLINAIADWTGSEPDGEKVGLILF